ncbi:ribosome silencing factor [Ilyobacter sp.]|uniref:ribosome silencing factor n=1 Tax=Ilyobacter sp. TaxID=3100343 RepID=UPI003561B788
MTGKLQTVVDAIESKKGKDILALDFQGESSLCDYAVICTGSSNRNIQAITDEVDKKIRESGEIRLGIEGYDEAKWVLIDLDDIVVHIMDEETRDFYKLEVLWNEAKEIIKR